MTTDTQQAVQSLRELAVELQQRRFAVRLRDGDGHPARLRVINPEAPVLTDSVMIATDAEGELWFWFPWPAPITPISDVTGAADQIERVLAEVGR